MRRIIALFAMLALAACSQRDAGSKDSSAAASNSSVDLTGAGATFPYPIYAKWTSDYAAEAGIKVNYQSIGSGGGVRQFSEMTVDFGASDAPMSDEEMTKAKGGATLHFPTVLGADVVSYNLPSLTQPLRLTPELIVDIFLGKLIKWNDQRLAAVNPGVPLPNSDVIVVHRSDGSGTTYVFTDYLSTVSKAWAAGPGRGKEVRWPVGLGGKGNEAVAGQIKQTPGAVGYVELAYARQNKLALAHIRNTAGNFVEPTIESIRAAAAGEMAVLGPDTDYRVSIVNAPGAQAYPLSSLTWLLVYQNQPDPIKGQKLVNFLKWIYAEGQESASALHYAPLPTELREQLINRHIAKIRVGGTAQ